MYKITLRMSHLILVTSSNKVGMRKVLWLLEISVNALSTRCVLHRPCTNIEFS